jgi:hypothetical protein
MKQEHQDWAARLLKQGETTSFDVALTARTTDQADAEAKERAAEVGAVVLALVYQGETEVG